MASHSKKITLLVENDANDEKLFRVCYENLPYESELVVKTDGDDALDFLIHSLRDHPLSHLQLSMMILDLKMHKINGLDVLKGVRSIPELRLLPVVIFSSSKQPQDIRDCYRHGANAYIVKPVDFNEFQRTVHQMIHFWLGTNEPPPPLLTET